VKRKIGIIIAWLVFSVTSFAEDGSEKLGDIDFKDISVVDAARVLSEVSSVNIIVSQEAESKRFSLFIRDTSIKDAIESICKITGLWYDYDREAKVFMIMTEEQYRKNITVYSNEKTKVFNLQHQNILMAVNSIEGIFGERVFVFEPEEDPSYLYEGDFSEESSSGSTSVTEINKTSNVVVNNTSTQIQGDKNNIDDVTVQQLADIRNMVNQTRIEQEKLNQLLSESQAPIRVTYNYNQNMVLVRSSDMDALEEIESLIKTIDVPTRQVLLEMKILQLTLGEDDKSVFEYGFDDGTTNFSINKNTDIDSATFLFSSLSNNISASIELLSQENKVKVLATPLIISANNREAELFIGEERTLVKGAEVSTTITDNIVYQTYTVKTEDRDIGNTLKIWPRINNDKTVTLDIEQESSSVLEDGQDVPVVVNDQIESMYTDLVTTATLDLTAIAKEGNTIAIGGLMRSERSETHRKIPLLGDIPGIGKIFRSDIESDANTEIVLLITPYIFDNFEDAQRAQVVLNQSNNPDRSAVIAEFKSRNQVRGELNKHEAQNAIRLSQAMANYKKSQTIESPFEIKAPQFRHWKLMNGLIIDATSTITDGYWYITSTRVRNNGQFGISLKPELFGSGWVGMLSQSTELAPGDQTEVSFISHKTPAAVLNTINADFMLTQHSMELE
jgi:type II secretory pathway component GspD/PulD (secretin)